MHLSNSTDPYDGSSCELTFDEQHDCLRAIWRGFVQPQEAHAGAERFLEAMSRLHCPYLLNDNSRLRGPWFDSVDWLRRVWAPQARRMGLRCIAHVAQPDHHAYAIETLAARTFHDTIDIQVFDTVADGERWLREQQAAAVPGPSRQVSKQ